MSSPDLAPGTPSPGYPAFWRSLKHDCIMAAWPEIFGPKHPIFRVTQMQRRPWRNLIDQLKMEAPWIVVEQGRATAESGWGACNAVYRPMVTIYYISDSTVSNDMGGFIEEKLAKLERVLQNQKYDGFQYWPGETSYDVTEDNPANRVFLSSNLPMFAGSLTFRTMFGYVASAGVRNS